MSERKEALMRIVVLIISGIILEVWKVAVYLATLFHFIYTLFTNKRHLGLERFSNMWVSQEYRFLRYMTFTTNQKPFPFTEMKTIEDIDMKKGKSFSK